MSWQPIETAPKDGTEVDLWVRCFQISEGGKVTCDEGRRVTGASWDIPRHYYLSGEPHIGTEEEWVQYEHGNLEEVEGGGVRATHWMPLPQSPEIDA